MRRKIYNKIILDLQKKMVFIVGPRQVGKTWLAKKVMEEYKNPIYLNYDNSDHREIIKRQSWLSDVDLIVFDEIHKMPKWKNYLKGVYDTKLDDVHMLVTGSARMDAFKKVGDSLAGRFFVHHLFPFTVSELKSAGVKMILYPLSAFRAMNQAALNVFQAIKKNGTQQSVLNTMQDRKTLYDFLDYEKFEKLMD